MDLNLYEYMVILTPFIILNFCLDYLSDSEITHSETKLGICQFLHHIIASILTFTIFLPFMSSKLTVVSVSIIVSLVTQVGFLINKDYCWLTRYVNGIINPENPNRKWTGGDIGSLIKKYLKSSEGAYTEMRQPNNFTVINTFNIIHLIVLIKIIIGIK